MKKYSLSLVTGLLFIGLAIATGYSNDVSYTYDQLNRLVAIEYLDGTRIEYTYDDLGNRITQNIFISSNPVANFTLSPTAGPAPLTVTFTDQSAGTITSRSWSFGDGGSSTSQNPV
ncbi:MAG: PKD domain-containing protein, partial [Syntrophobacteraceae bacterium]